MSESTQARSREPETDVEVDLGEPDPSKAVSRRPRNNIAAEARAEADDSPKPRTKAEKELFKRMSRFERNLTKQFDQQRAEDEARHQRELTELRQQVQGGVRRDTDNGDAADAEHERQIKDLRDKLVAAQDRGDSATVADLTVQISRLDNRYWAQKAAKAGQVTREQAPAQTQAQTGTRGRTSNGTSAGPTLAGARFMTANEDWWADPQFKVEKGAASTIYVELVNEEGFEADSDETFREVAKRLKKKFPHLEVHAHGERDQDEDDDDRGAIDEGETQHRNPRRNAPTGNISDRGGVSLSQRMVGGNSKRSLTEKEKGTMRAAGLNPDNDRDVMAFVREIVAAER